MSINDNIVFDVEEILLSDDDESYESEHNNESINAQNTFEKFGITSCSLKERKQLLSPENEISLIIDEYSAKKSTMLDLNQIDLFIFPDLLNNAIDDGLFDNLTCLNLCNCNISVIDLSLFCLESLCELNMNDNNIHHIPPEIKYLKNLSNLKLGFNQISEIPEESKELTMLEYIDISYNKLHDIPKYLPYESLKMVRLNGNCNICSFDNLKIFSNTVIIVENNPHLIEYYNNNIDQFENTNIVWENNFPSKITDNIYLGGITSVSCEDIYNVLNIEAIYTIGNRLDPLILPHIKHEYFLIDDNPKCIMSFEIIDKIHETITENKKCIIHCQKGMSRSATITIAYLMKYHHLSLNDAYNHVKLRRDCICPNEGFMDQLVKFEENLKNGC